MTHWPRYFVTRTLIGGEPDCNARIIHRGADGEEVWRRKPGPAGWSKEDETALKAELKRLMDAPDDPAAQRMPQTWAEIFEPR